MGFVGACMYDVSSEYEQLHSHYWGNGANLVL